VATPSFRKSVPSRLWPLAKARRDGFRRAAVRSWKKPSAALPRGWLDEAELEETHPSPRPRNCALTLHMGSMAVRTDDASAGWKVTIRVPQPNGADVYHLWVVAIADERETRERLLLPDLPGEARLEPLSTDELADFGLEPGEVRRIS
jgi:hypothetical protein